MKFFSPKYPQFILGIFLCFTFFFAMPVESVQACTTEKPVIEAGKKLAKIFTNNGSVGDDVNQTPQNSQKPCYIKINEGQTSVTKQELLNANIITPAQKEMPLHKRFMYCDENTFSDDYSHLPASTCPPGNGLCQRSAEILTFISKAGCAEQPSFGVGADTYNEATQKRMAYSLGDDFYLFFMGTEEGNKDEQEKLVYCKDALAIYNIKTEGPDKDKNCDPSKYIPEDKINDNDFFIKTGLSSMPLECKQVYENCMREGGDASSDSNAADPRYGKPDGYEGPLPDCAFSYDGCRSINDVLQFLVNLGQQVFKYIGTFAFVMFIYGGFTMILSMGSAEKVKKGQEILTAAVVGIIISFGAYLLIDFILDALQVGQDFRSIGALEKKDEIPNPNTKR